MPRFPHPSLPPRVVLFTGSGLSAESGIPTYRGEGGLYHGNRMEDLMSARTWKNDPDFLLRFMDERRVEMADKRPNPAHRAIADFARLRQHTSVLTQNIDWLLEEAGCSNVVHLHGVLRQMRCLNKGETPGHVVDIGHTAYDGRRCPACNARMRPNVVLFGEDAPRYRTMWSTFSRLGEADTLLVVGTQGNVIPISDVILADRRRGKMRYRTILVNLHRSDDIDESAFDEVYLEPAGLAVPHILDRLAEVYPADQREDLEGSSP